VHPAGYFMHTRQMRETVWSEDNGLRLVEKVILGLLCMFAGSDGWCHPGVAKLGRMASTDRTTVWRALGELESRGLIERKRQGRRFLFRINRAELIGCTQQHIDGEYVAHSNLIGCTQQPDMLHTATCIEGTREVTNEGGGTPTPLFDRFWDLLPAGAAIKKPGALELWSGLALAEQLAAVRWVEERLAAGRDVPEARYVLLDRRWEDKAPPPPPDPREREIAWIEREYADEAWCETVVEWMRADPTRTTKVGEALRAVMGGGD